jgi:hypothetical protein
MELKNQACRLQDHLQKGDIKIYHLPTILNISHKFTKPLPTQTFMRCIANALNPDDIIPPIAQNASVLLLPCGTTRKRLTNRHVLGGGEECLSSVLSRPSSSEESCL